MALTFTRARLAADPIPRTPSGMPQDMAERAWGEDRYLPALGLEASAQTGRHTSRPFIAFGRSFPGVQRKNGVSQLDVGFTAPEITGITAPYWQQTVRVNPPTFLRGGGGPYPPQGPYQIAQMTVSGGQSNIGDIGPSAYFAPAAGS